MKCITKFKKLHKELVAERLKAQRKLDEMRNQWVTAHSQYARQALAERAEELKKQLGICETKLANMDMAVRHWSEMSSSEIEQLVDSL